MRINEVKIYHYDELSEQAKTKAREWFATNYPDYNWWDYLYEDFDKRAAELGIELSRKPVKLMNGKTRYEPEIYFTGFYHQGSGSSFAGRWSAQNMRVADLLAECPTETELHRIADVLANCAKEDEELWADIKADGDNWIHVEVNDGETIADRLNNLEYKSAEYNQLAQACRQREDEVLEALQDFNRWIYKQLKTEYEYLTSEKQIEESIRANEYEFTEDGSIA